MGAPRMRDRGSAYWRPMMSTEPPGGNGTTSVIGREGYLSSARAASGASADRPARPRPAPSSLRRGGAGGGSGEHTPETPPPCNFPFRFFLSKKKNTQQN